MMPPPPTAARPCRWYQILYVQVLAAIALGILVGAIWPEFGEAVTGAGFITLAATLSVVSSVPVAGLALIIGVDRFMSECRRIANFIGRAVATIVGSKWEGGPGRDALKAALSGGDSFDSEHDTAII